MKAFKNYVENVSFLGQNSKPKITYLGLSFENEIWAICSSLMSKSICTLKYLITFQKLIEICIFPSKMSIPGRFSYCGIAHIYIQTLSYSNIPARFLLTNDPLPPQKLNFIPFTLSIVLWDR